MKVLNIDKKLSRIRVLRSIDGTMGSSHPPFEEFLEVSKKIIIKSNSNEGVDYKLNKELYFDPNESINLGTNSIYIEDHNLNTGDVLTYSSNTGSPITVSREENLSSPTPLLNQQRVLMQK